VSAILFSTYREEDKSFSLIKVEVKVKVKVEVEWVRGG